MKAWQTPRTCGECRELIGEPGSYTCYQTLDEASEEDRACPLFMEREKVGKREGDCIYGATGASREIECLTREIKQLNEYIHALECMLVYGFANADEVRSLIAAFRQRFAPDVDFPEAPRLEAEDDGNDN